MPLTITKQPNPSLSDIDPRMPGWVDMFRARDRLRALLSLLGADVDALGWSLAVDAAMDRCRDLGVDFDKLGELIAQVEPRFVATVEDRARMRQERDHYREKCLEAQADLTAANAKIAELETSKAVGYQPDAGDWAELREALGCGENETLIDVAQDVVAEKLRLGILFDAAELETKGLRAQLETERRSWSDLSVQVQSADHALKGAGLHDGTLFERLDTVFTRLTASESRARTLEWERDLAEATAKHAVEEMSREQGAHTEDMQALASQRDSALQKLSALESATDIDRVGRIVRKVAEWSPEVVAGLIGELVKRHGYGPLEEATAKAKAAEDEFHRIRAAAPPGVVVRYEYQAAIDRADKAEAERDAAVRGRERAERNLAAATSNWEHVCGVRDRLATESRAHLDTIANLESSLELERRELAASEQARSEQARELERRRLVVAAAIRARYSAHRHDNLMRYRVVDGNGSLLDCPLGDSNPIPEIASAEDLEPWHLVDAYNASTPSAIRADGAGATEGDDSCSVCWGSGGGLPPMQCGHCNGSGNEPATKAEDSDNG
jgi:hypothetical protein